MPVRKRSVWKVESGSHTRWFWEERHAREYASQRFDAELEGVPWINELTDVELIGRLNQLEAKEQ